MLKPKKMCKVIIAGPIGLRGKTVTQLYDQGALHIKDYVKSKDDEILDIGTPSIRAATDSEYLIKLRSIKKHLNIDSNEKTKKTELEKSNVLKQIDDIDSKIVTFIDKIKEQNDLLSIIDSKEKIVAPVSKLGLDWKVFSEYGSLSYMVGYLPKNVDISTLKKDISKITDDYQLYSSEYLNKHVIAVFVIKEKEDEISDLLQKKVFTPINLKCLEQFKGNSDEILNQVQKQRKEINDTKDKLNSELNNLKEQYGSFIIKHEKTLSKNIDICEAPLRFAESKNAFVIEGWIPKDNSESVESELRDKTEGNIYINITDAKEDAPIELNNPKGVRPFESLINLYSLPSYGEIDPTFFMFLTFPLFFGFMLGDLGYGLLTFALFFVIRQKTKSQEIRSVLSILLFASFMTAVFGIIFGEFFGGEQIFGYHMTPILHRLHHPITLLNLSIGLGVAHVNMGLLIGFYNMLKVHGLKAAILEKASWMTLQVGGVLMALGNMTLGASILLISTIMITLGEGLKGLFELPSIVANILSYSRLMAVGLASAILALVVNEMAGMAFSSGGIGLIMGTIILVAGHSIAIFLGFLSPFIHSMRLHYVEFFMKFYQGGGKKYMPFGKKE